MDQLSRHFLILPRYEAPIQAQGTPDLPEYPDEFYNPELFTIQLIYLELVSICQRRWLASRNVEVVIQFTIAHASAGRPTGNLSTTASVNPRQLSEQPRMSTKSLSLGVFSSAPATISIVYREHDNCLLRKRTLPCRHHTEPHLLVICLILLQHSISSWSEFQTPEGRLGLWAFADNDMETQTTLWYGPLTGEEPIYESTQPELD
ncbi:hypothetical protein C8J56DRAFT_1051351 [Mycena floridula]|nr:hypothetical protein C8J56DRAFT_1051351 [Mycena floridula]